jgi:hypothetical protein
MDPLGNLALLGWVSEKAWIITLDEKGSEVSG